MTICDRSWGIHSRVKIDVSPFSFYLLWRQHVATRWFSRTCGRNAVMDPGQWNTKSRWLSPAALASYLYQLGGPHGQHCMSSKICAGCPRHFKLLACVSSNFWLGHNSKITKQIITRFQMAKTSDHYLCIYQKLSLLSSLSNEAKIRLTLWAQPWNRIRSN